MSGATDTGPFTLIPEWVLYHPGLSDRAVRLYGALGRYADDTGLSWPSRRSLASRLGCSPDSVDRARAELESAGAVRVEARFDDDRQTSNLYRIIRVPPAPVRPPLGTGAEGGVGTTAEPPLGTGAAPRTRTRKNETQGNDPAVPAEVSPRGDAAAKVRARNVQWDGLVAVFGPADTEGQRTHYGKVSRSLKAAGATYDEIVARGNRARQEWPGCTIAALDKNWGLLGDLVARGAHAQRRVDAPEWDRDEPSGVIDL